MFSPISHWHHIASEYELPTNYEFWHTYNCTILSVCSEMRIVTSEGWNKSKGVKAEIDFCLEKGIPFSCTVV